MKRTATFAAGSMLLAAALAAVPGTAQSETTEAKVLLLNESFTGTAVGDPDLHSLNACLTASLVEGGEFDFNGCADHTDGPVPTSGKEPGYLLLTDAGNFHSGGMVYNKPLPSEHGIEVTFAQYQYGGTGADGISFFLVDGDTDLTEAGAYGGSLGYAQHTSPMGDEPGVDGGYLGLGLDAWGNFSADTEGRGDGCDEAHQAPEQLQISGNRAPDTVALRGPGQGVEGYCLLATTATDEEVGTYGSATLYGTSLSGHLESDALETAKRLVKLKVVETAGEPRVTVDLNFMEGAGWERVLETTVPHAMPDTFKFGFAASTGGATDVHLIRHLRVETFPS